MIINTYKPATDFLTLVELLQWRAIYQPKKIAYTFLVDGETEEVHLTYEELDRQARSIAILLNSLNATGERALLFYPPGLEFIAAFFGCLYAGVVAVPVYPPHRNQYLAKLQAIVTDAQALFALTTTSLEPSLKKSPELASLHYIATNNLPNNIVDNSSLPRANSDTLAFLQYTSGSTGTPKGVMISHGNLLHNELVIKTNSGHTEESTYVSWLPHYHDMGLINLIQSLYIGARCILIPPTAFLQTPYRWLHAISRYKAHTSGGPNFAYELCVRKITPEQLSSLDLSSWQVAFNGAEPIQSETLQQFASTFAPCGFRLNSFSPCYGLAESTTAVTGSKKGEFPILQTVLKTSLEHNRVIVSSPDDKNAQTFVSSGKTWLDQRVRIVDPTSYIECLPGQVGEIWVSGASVALGYWNKHEETKHTFRAYLADTKEGPFLRTGDLGFLQQGELFVTGRLKDMVIIRGRNHYPQDIELTVEKSHPALKPGCGAAFTVEVNGERLVIVQEVERSYLRKLNVSEVVGNIREAVAIHHELQVYAVVLVKTGSIPKTSSGKIQRHTCRQQYIDETLEIVNSENETPPALTQTQKIAITNNPLQKRQKRLALATVGIPFLGSVLAVGLLWQVGISAVDIGLLVSMYVLTAIGVTVGYHRHFTHCAFRTSNVMRIILAILGSMAGQGPPIYWVATHRRHHQYSDIPGDAHSPNLHGEGIWNKLQGLFHAHIGWILDLEPTNTMLFAKDLVQDSAIYEINKLYFWWLFLGLAIPAILGGILTGTSIGVLSGFLWGGLVRIFLGQQFTYSINSICHVYGKRSFDTQEQSKNNILFAILLGGEGWHNNHHAFPHSAKFGLKWWQIDMGWWCICVFEKLGLVWDVKTPTAKMIEAKKS